MTEGTLARKRTTGCRMLLIQSGANSTMKTATKSAEKRARMTAPPVIRIVDPDQRPGVEGVDVAGAGFGREWRSR